MWIPHYIDMNPHFSQNILNKGIFQMWIHHYKDMNPHKSKHIKVVYIFRMLIHRYIDMYPHCLDKSFLVFNVFYSQLSVYRDIFTFASHGIKYVNVSTLPSL